MSANNIVIFPKGKKDSPPQTIEEVVGGVLEAKAAHVDFLLDELGSYIFTRAHEEGFHMMTDDNMKINTLMIESMRSALYESVGIPHFLHDVAEDLITDEDFEIEEEQRDDIS